MDRLPDNIIDRACELWVRAMRAPIYDNGDKSPQGLLAEALVASLPRNSDEPVLAKFRQELKRILSEPFTYEPFREGADPWVARVDSLLVDYHPDQPLRTAAERAGLKTEFPWKTSMHLEHGVVSFRQGYGAHTVYHYPLDSGLWLVTTLRGADRDVDALLDFARSGQRADFFIVEHDNATEAVAA